ncbi:hypothetical protein EC844_102161 [Acinetobacter calcoaceticus]|uniref:Lipoprotein n=1 Tax=Acinetobacter calcoaceticus TaxID=471 RepID=A0A4R1Y9V8_ACICA|nr:hypothetical protein EC844_102161 [Acinetobacter calcoaceticus]
MLNFHHKVLWCLALCATVSTLRAEVLVILPETGGMARAGLSIQQGIESANQVNGANINFKFVNAHGNSMASLYKNHVNKKTQLVIGPLARQDVENLLKLDPKIPVLALNEIEGKHKNVLQFSLSKDADAQALANVFIQDKLETLYVLRQAEAESESESFLNLIKQKFSGNIEFVEDVPKKIKKNQGVLLLGNNQWINALKKLPSKNIYAQAIAIADNQPMPIGLKFCDVPAIYQAKWPDVIQSYQKQPTSMPYQRLLAFGGDAWEISQAMLKDKSLKNFSFSGRTGYIQVVDGEIQRMPICFMNTKKGLAVI